MTEEHWLGWRDPREFLQSLAYQLNAPAAGRLTDRKLRLFAAGCGRRATRLCPDPRLAAAVAAAEAFADARTNADRAGPKAVRRDLAADPEWPHTPPGRLARAVAGRSGRVAAIEASWWASYLAGGSSGRAGQERELQGPLLRDVIGNPFRPASFDPVWRTEAVVGLGRGMYESSDFGPMPVLADALEDAGCAAPDLLAHCRAADPHIRGCWVVDLVLGKV